MSILSSIFSAIASVILGVVGFIVACFSWVLIGFLFGIGFELAAESVRAWRQSFVRRVLVAIGGTVSAFRNRKQVSQIVELEEMHGVPVSPMSRTIDLDAVADAVAEQPQSSPKTRRTPSTTKTSSEIRGRKAKESAKEAEEAEKELAGAV